MENFRTPPLRPVIWLGSSKKNIRDFPKGAQKLLGDELQLIQFGGTPKDVKPFKGIGSGVLEIALRYASDAYRVVVRFRSASGSMFCMPFRRNRREASKHQSGMLT